MRIVVRLLLAWFAFFGLALGLWQWLFPASFYADFPGLGHRWVSPDGPYNEHLMRDVGQGNLAVGTVALVALLTGVVWLARAVGLAAVAANVPHHVYHQANVSILPGPADQVLQSLTLSAVTVAAIVLAVSAFRLPADPAPSGRRTVPASSAPTDPARS
jgi:hypothetical protein